MIFGEQEENPKYQPIQFEWWEWYTLKPTPEGYNDLAPFTWHNVYEVAEIRNKSETFKMLVNITPSNLILNFPQTYKLTDRPRFNPGGSNLSYVQYAFFAIRVSYNIDCGCPYPRWWDTLIILRQR